MTIPRNEELREEFEQMLDKRGDFYQMDNRKYLKGDNGSLTRLDFIEDFWLSHLTAERTALIEEIKNHEPNANDVNFEEDNYYAGKRDVCLDLLSRLESGNQKIQ